MSSSHLARLLGDAETVATMVTWPLSMIALALR